MGNKTDLQKAIELLDEVKESIINAYEMKTHLSRAKIAKMMDDETWLNAKKALQMGFVDGILFAEKQQKTPLSNRKTTPKLRKKKFPMRMSLTQNLFTLCKSKYP